MNSFHPADAGLSDLWCVSWRGVAHLFYLSIRLEKDEIIYTGGIGHAISDNLLNWQELPPAVIPEIDGGVDDLPPWTGSCIATEEALYLYYTGRCTNGPSQSICLAISHDGLTFEKYSGNPILTPDPAICYTYETPATPGYVDCRDFSVTYCQEESCWYGYYAARLSSIDTLCGSAAICAVTSTDLIHWKYCCEPAFVPNRYGVVELPHVFYHDHRWYMLALVHFSWYNRNVLGGPNLQRGTICAISDQPRGPFHLLANSASHVGKANVLPASVLCAGETQDNAFSHCSMMWCGERIILSCDRDIPGTATLSVPFSLKTSDEMQFLCRADHALSFCSSDSPISSILDSFQPRLFLCHTPLTDGLRTELLKRPDNIVPLSPAEKYSQVKLANGTITMSSNGTYHAKAVAGWQHRLLDITIPSDCEIACDIEMKGIAAGIIAGSSAVILDAFRNELMIGNWKNAFADFRTRPLPFLLPEVFKLFCRFHGMRLEVYLQDVLIYQAGIKLEKTRQPGFLIDTGTANFLNMTIWRI